MSGVAVDFFVICDIVAVFPVTLLYLLLRLPFYGGELKISKHNDAVQCSGTQSWLLCWCLLCSLRSVFCLPSWRSVRMV